MARKLSRRQLLRLGALSASGVLIGCAPQIVKETVVVKEEVEKVVKETVIVTEEKVVEKPVEKVVKETVVVEKVVTAEPAQTITTVRFMIWGGAAEKEAWNARYELFQGKYPNIMVAIMFPPGTYAEKLTAMIASGTAPDVFVSSSLRIDVPRGILLPLDAYLEMDSDYDTNDLLPGTLERGQYQGVQYAIPGGIGPQVVFWNVDYFDEAGLENPNDLYEKGEWTPDKFLEYCQKLTVKEGDRYTRFGFMFYWPEYVPFLHGMNAPMFNPEYTTCLFDEKTRSVVQWFADLINVEHVSPMPDELGEFGSWPGFRDGKYGMFISGPWQQARLADSTYKWDIAWPPMEKDGVPCMSAGASGSCVYALSKVPWEAYRWASFIESKESQAIWAGLGFDLPVHRSLIPDYVAGKLFTNQKAMPPSVGMWFNVAEKCVPMWTGGWLTPQVENLINSAWGVVKSGEMTADEAFGDQLIKDINTALVGV